MKSLGIDVGIDGNALDTHLPRSADDAQGNLASVGDENAIEHEGGTPEWLRGEEETRPCGEPQAEERPSG